MSFVKVRLKELAADFGVAPKEISEIIGKFGEKPKSNSQVLTDTELNQVFEVMTQTHQISSLEQVFAQAPSKAQEKKAEEKKAEEKKPEAKKPEADKKPQPSKPEAKAEGAT